MSIQCDLKNENCGIHCTGYDGAKIWDERKAANKKISCESCRDEAEHLEIFTHDIVNARLGRSVFDKRNFHNYVKIVNCTADKCRTDGRC